MILRWLAPLLLLVPQDAVKPGPLQIAWASQYEWTEHDVKTVALDFTYEGSETATGKEDPTPTWMVEGMGSVVLGETGIIRVHLPGASTQDRDRITKHINWVADRFVRLPYEERFKDVEVAAPEELPGGTLKIVAGEEIYRIKDDRITGIDRRLPGTAVKIKRYTEVFDVRPMPAGYAHHGSRALYTTQDRVADLTLKTENDLRRKLELRTEDDVPFPKTYTFKHTKRRAQGTVVELTISFGKPKVNEEHAVAGDPEARDLLKAAWDQRYTLPMNVRIQGKWKRDSPGAQARWGNGLYEGSFLVHGLDDISVRLEMDRAKRWQASWIRDVNDRIVGELKWLFDHLRPVPFEEEFKGCGFTKVDDKDSTVIQVAGHTDVLAFRLRKSQLVARLDNTSDGDLWWEFKWKKLPDGRQRLESSTRRMNRKKYEEKISYSKKKGLYVPKKWARFKSWSARGKRDYGLDKWELTGLKVDVPSGP